MCHETDRTHALARLRWLILTLLAFVLSSPAALTRPATAQAASPIRVIKSAATAEQLSITGFDLQAVVNGSYRWTSRVSNGQPVWESVTHTIEYGTVEPGRWEILLKPGETGAARPAVCATGGDPGWGPFDCVDWQEWVGSSLGFFSVTEQVRPPCSRVAQASSDP